MCRFEPLTGELGQPQQLLTTLQDNSKHLFALKDFSFYSDFIFYSVRFYFYSVILFCYSIHLLYFAASTSPVLQGGSHNCQAWLCCCCCCCFLMQAWVLSSCTMTAVC
jgi:hypothetical protein